MDTSDVGSVKPTVYIETSIVSYLTARPSRDLLVAAHQQLTVTWWDEQRTRYELFTSQVVLAEARAGDPRSGPTTPRRTRAPPALGRDGCGDCTRHAARHQAGAARASGPRCAPSRHYLRPRGAVSPHVELH